MYIVSLNNFINTNLLSAVENVHMHFVDILYHYPVGHIAFVEMNGYSAC